MFRLMIPFFYWKVFLKVLQYGCAVVAVITNSILIVLIIFRSPKHLGAYKYLMIYISLFEVSYSILDAIVEPNVFSHGPAFIVFRYFKQSFFSRNAGFYLFLVYSGTFGVSLAIFGVHFIYRYGAVDIDFRKKYTLGRKLYALFLVPIFYGVWWSTIVFFCFRSNRQSDAFIRNPLLASFDTRIEDVSYVIVWFYAPDNQNQLAPILSTFFGMACVWLMLSSSFFCVMYFGAKCYLKIKIDMKRSKMSSYYTKTIQQQLFHGLVMQTLIPLVLMYIPSGILFLFPMLNIEIGFISNFVTASIAIYPAVDPLPTMFIVKNYREALHCKCRFKKKRQIEQSVELHVI